MLEEVESKVQRYFREVTLVVGTAGAGSISGYHAAQTVSISGVLFCGYCLQNQTFRGSNTAHAANTRSTLGFCIADTASTGSISPGSTVHPASTPKTRATYTKGIPYFG